MSKIVQWKRGNTSATSTYVGFPGEITVDVDTWQLHIHDGITPGGHIANSSSQTGNIIPGQNNTYNLGSNSLAWKDAWISNSIVINNNTLTIDSGGNLTINGASPSASTSNISIVKTLSNNTTSIATLGNTDLQITATDGATQSTIYLWANTHKMGFNTISNAYDYNFNGYISATSYVASVNDPTGYSFYTPGEGYSGFSHVNANISYLQVSHDGVPVAKFLTNLTTQMIGNLVVSDTGTNYGVFPNAFFQLYSNVNSYTQLVMQNLSDGSEASSDIVLTSNDGTDSTHFIDMGISNSNYSFPGYGILKPRDGYVVVVGTDVTGPGSMEMANLVMGSTNGNVKVFVGAPEDANLIASFATAGLIPGANVAYDLGSDPYQWKDAWIANSIVINNNTLTVDSNGNLTINGVSPSTSNISIVKTLSNNTTSIATLGNTDLQITATDGAIQSTIYLRANSPKMGFNTISDAFDYNFNGYISATSYVASKNDPTGYSFYTPGEGYSGFSHVNAPINYIQVTHNDVPSFKFLSNNTVDITGNLVVSAEANVFGSFPNAFIQTYSNINTYSQLISQNLNNGIASTSDFVATANDGTDLTDYIDLGISGSGYDNTSPFNSLGTSVDPRDGYLYVQGNVDNVYGGNLVVGTTLPGKVTKILAGGINAENVVVTFGETVMAPTANAAYNLGSQSSQWNDLWIGGNTIISSNAPTLSTDPGVPGQITWDADYVYVCTAPNSWKRANLSSW